MSRLASRDEDAGSLLIENDLMKKSAGFPFLSSVRSIETGSSQNHRNRRFRILRDKSHRPDFLMTARNGETETWRYGKNQIGRN